MKDVAVLGPLNIDLLMVGEGPPNWEALPSWSGPADMEMTAAGSVGYFVADLAKLGNQVGVVSCLPADSLGNFILDSLRSNHVDVHHVRQVPDTVCAIGAYILLFGSRKRPLAYRMPSHDPWPLSFSDEERAYLLDARALHCGGYLHFESTWHGETIGLFKEAKARGLLTSVDSQFPLHAMAPPWLPGIEDLLPHVDLLLCDEDEARRMTAEDDLDRVASRLMAAGPETVVIKRGAEGSLVYTADRRIEQPAIRLGELVDSIGAGDAYDAAFVMGMLEGWPLERCAAFASVAAGFTVTGVGGSATMPTRKQVEERLQRL
jgi:2-dehydro-3-deoxygluconokinase